MGEQGRRTTDRDSTSTGVSAEAASRTNPTPGPTDTPRALSPEADERQTVRQAPTTAAPGESAEDDSIG
jgi:hypothetical protein